MRQIAIKKSRHIAIKFTDMSQDAMTETTDIGEKPEPPDVVVCAAIFP